MLNIENLHVRYGGIRALKGVSIHVEENKIVALLGSNGAGKSTTVRAVSGVAPIQSGNISFSGKSLNGLSVHEIQRLGLVQIPEGRKIFSNLTVKENLIMGAYHTRYKVEVSKRMDRILHTFPALESKLDQKGGTLSGGQQQMLAIGRALIGSPKLMMMDEPSLGLAPMMVSEVFRVIQEIRAEGVTIFLIEQNADAALRVADEAYVMETGTIVLHGSGAALMDHPMVKQAYLGHPISDA